MRWGVAGFFDNWRRFIERTAGRNRRPGIAVGSGDPGTETPSDAARATIADLERHARRPGPAGGVARRILLLDDDALVRRTTAAVLRDAGFIVADPDDAKSALGLLDAGMPYDLLIVDLSMPDMSGDVFAIEARRRRPGLPVLFMTGYPNGLSATREEPCLLKPCRRAEILGTIDTILSASPMVDCDPPFEMPSGGAWERSRDRLRVLSASERYGDR